jgi:hypothetical protein
MSDEAFDNLDGVVPDTLQDDTYLCNVDEASIVKSKKDGRRWFIIKWTIEQPASYAGWEVSDVYRVADASEYEKADGKGKAEIRQAKTKRNARLMQLGVPRDMLNDVAKDLDQLAGIKAWLSITVRAKKNPTDGYNIWINDVTLASAVDENSLLDNSNF